MCPMNYESNAIAGYLFYVSHVSVLQRSFEDFCPKIHLRLHLRFIFVAVQMNKDDIIVLPDNTCTLYSKFCLVTTQFLGDAAIIQTAFVYV